MAQPVSLAFRIAANLTDLRANLAEAKVQLETTKRAMQQMANSFDGSKVIADSNAMVKAIHDIGGASKLTESEQRRVNATVAEALAKYQALGREAPPALRQLEEATRRVEAPTSGLSTKMVALGAAVGTALGQMAYGAINRLGGELMEFVHTGAKLPAMESSFRRLAVGIGQDADGMRDRMRTATLGLVSNYDMMAAANKAMLLGLPVTAENMGELAKTATVLGRAMGMDATKSLDDLITALGRSSPMILDNLGLSVKLGEANEAYAAKLGKTVEQLTDAEKKTAFYEEAMRKAEEKTAQLGDTTKTLGEILSSVWTSIGNVISEKAGKANQDLGRMLTDVTNIAKLLAASGNPYAALKAAGEIARGRIEDENRAAWMSQFMSVDQLTATGRQVGPTPEEIEAQKKAADAAKKAAEAFKAQLDAMTGVVTIQKAKHDLDLIAAAQSQRGISLANMTLAEQDRINKSMAEAIDVYRRLGKDAPPELMAVWRATADLSYLTNRVATVDLKELEKGFKGLPQIAIPTLRELGVIALEATKPFEQRGMDIVKLFQVTATETEKAIERGKDAAKKAADETREKWQRVSGAFGDVAGILDNIPGKLFEIASMAARAGKAIADNLAEGDVWGAVIAGATAAVGIIGRLFGVGQTDYEKRVKANADAVKTITAEAIKAAGGMDKLRERAAIVGIEIDAAFRTRDAKWIEEVLGDVEERTQRLQSAMEKYGISWEDLGEKAKQSKINAIAEDLLLDFEILITAGADVNLVIEKMGDAILEFVEMARRTGTEIPLGMKPVLQTMIDMGLITDENGVAFKSLEDAGLTFAESFASVGDRVVAAIDRIAAALGYVFSEYDGRTLRLNVDADGLPEGNRPPRDRGTDGGDPEIHAAGGFEGWVSRQTRFTVAEGNRPEYVSVTPGGQSGGGMLEATFIMPDGQFVARQLVRVARTHRRVGS